MIGLLIFYVAIMVVLAISLLVVVKQRDKRAAERDERQRKIECLDGIIHDLRKRVEKSDELAARTVLAVTPLIEKTDWMTGRWHGQFSTLVSLENKRNALVEHARRVLMDIPVVEDHVRQNGVPLGRLEL